MTRKSDIGVIGLAVMGENLILNLESKGFQVSAFNRTTSAVDSFVSGRAKGKHIVGTLSLQEFVDSLERPRKIMLMVKAGQAVDAVISQLVPLLEKGDIIIDGGNSHFADTERRYKELKAKGILYVGTGVSGGEEGALLGPSIMPGGDPEAWPHVKPIFQAIAARTPLGEVCCEWIGEGGAGHFVKMVHNGIEYGDMQMICEVYQIMRDVLKLNNDEMSAIFATWNTGELDSYLIEITRDILSYRDENGQETLDYILDAAGQKGTGKWMGIAALELGEPLTLIVEAVFARTLSSMKDERVKASKVLGGDKPRPAFTGDRQSLINDLRDALYASKIISYAQGYELMSKAAETYGWKLKLGEIALIWRGGCIIRSRFLGRIKDAYDRDPKLQSLLLDPFFAKVVTGGADAWARVVATAVQHRVAVPCIGSALAFFDGYRSPSGPANLLQAQRDFFGAHTYERTDQPRGEFFHTNWTGRGGTTASRVYKA